MRCCRRARTHQGHCGEGCNGMATAPMISSINVLTAWRVRSVRFICQRRQRRPSFSRPKPTCCGCVRTFRWLTRKSLRWRMDSLPTKSCCQSWPTYRRRQDRLPGNSAESISCNCRWVNSRHAPIIGRCFASFAGNLWSADHFSGKPTLQPSGF
jgi:hypothetical protein